MRWLDAEKRFAEELPNFQVRENQRALALEIEESFGNSGHLLAQAGCGTGKSFAGIVPAIAHAKRMGKPVILATATKALQDQYSEKDLPLLQRVLGDFTFAVVKGRGNYVCLSKVDELNQADKMLVEQRIAEAGDGFSGELVDLKVDLPLGTTSDECPGRAQCPFGTICFAEVAKDRAKTADVVVANHAVLAADLAVRQMLEDADVSVEDMNIILPAFSGVVVDEAHELEEYVTSSLGSSLTAGAFNRLGNDVSKVLLERDPAKLMLKHSEELFRFVSKALDKRAKKSDRNIPLDSDMLMSMADPMDSLISALRGLSTKVKNLQIYNDDRAQMKRSRLKKRLNSMIDRLLFFMTADFDQIVRWLSVAEGSRGDMIEWAPLTVSEFLANNLWSRGPAVLMSATLALGDDFSFIAERLGLESYDSFDAGSPFDFTEQARTFIPQIAVPTKKEEWRSSVIAMTGEMVEASNGRALLLFTSKTEMNESYRSLAPMIKRMGHRTLKQGDLPTKELAQLFKEDEHSVLFALKSFFTGIDVQGDSLRLVVIDKLPFPVPTDVIWAARCDAIDQGGNPFSANGSFNRMSVPTMALSILQAYGRLIRTVEDHGLVAIMDSRLKGKNVKPYGPKIMKALPDAPVLTSLSEATAYLEGLGA